MLFGKWPYFYPWALVPLALSIRTTSASLQARVAGHVSASNESAPASWQSPASWRHGFKKSFGALIIDTGGVHFRSAQGPGRDWPWVEIQTFDLLTARRLVLTSYENRTWRRRGDRRFRFDLSLPVPATVARALAERVGKPARNGEPEPQTASFATLPARHRTLAGGTNGTLRFRDDGIDYVVQGERGGRSWRWSDIQTLANPDPYHLRVAGYRERFDFELKQPMARELFDRLWDHVYGHDLNVSPATGGMRHESTRTE